MTTDLVSRLRNHEGAYLFPKTADRLMEEAADEIERLEAFAASCIAAGGTQIGEIERLREQVARLAQEVETLQERS